MMQQTGLRAGLYLALTLASGAAVGALGMWMFQARAVTATVGSDASYRERYMAEMQTRLNLTEDQRTRLTSILDASREQFRQLNEKHRPEYDAVHLAQVEQIRSLLDDAQKAEYTKLRAEREERRKKSRR